jgi:uncharacterized protein YggE
MKTKILLVAGVVAILALISLVGCTTGGAGITAGSGQTVINMNNQQGIWVNGEGKVTITPDIATISVGISAEAAKVVEAQAQAAAAMEKVMAVLTGNGIDKKDIKTQYFSIQPMMKYDNLKQESYITGYQVSNMVTVKIRAVEKAGLIIDAVATAGGDNTRVNGISFSVDQPEKYLEQARTSAMNDAKAKAQKLAGLAGVTLGKAVYITESSYSQPGPYPVAMRSDMASGAAPATEISPGQADITLNVQINYAIQ